MTLNDLITLKADSPDSYFLVHDGYDGWCYGSPLNPIPITLNTAVNLLSLIEIKQKVDPVQKLRDNPTLLQYANQGDEYYIKTSNCRFIAFLPLSKCSFRDSDDNKISSLEIIGEREFDL